MAKRAAKKAPNQTGKEQNQLAVLNLNKVFGDEEFTPIELKPIKAKDKSSIPRFCVLDLESYKWTNFVVGGMYFQTRSKGEQYKTYDNLYDYMVECFRVARIFKITDFIAHFGGKFDFLFFLSVLAPDPLFIIKNMIPRSSSILSITVEMNATVAAQRNIPFCEEEITFRDSAALLTASLGSLTKTFGVEALKGELDFAFIKQIYDGRDYFDELFKSDQIVVFYGKEYRQVFSPKDYRQKRSSIRYWNMERYPLFPRAKKANKFTRLAPYKVKADWAEEITYPLFTRNDLMKYLYHDCKGLYQCLEKFFSWSLVSKTKKTWTIAGQAVNVFRLFLKTPLYSIPDHDKYADGNVDAFVREAYFGGRTEVFKPIFDAEVLNLDWLYYYDVNSLYPTMMSKFKYPNKFKARVYGPSQYNPKDLGVWKCRVRVPKDMYMPPLPVKHNMKLIFPTGDFTGQWTIYEIEYAKSCGVEVLEYIEGCIFEDGGYVFKSFINSLYELRLEAKRNKDKVTDTMTKLIMNSTYGRMGISKEKNNLVFDVGQEAPLRLITELEVNGINLRLSEVPAEMGEAFSNVAIACYVTSYARVHLHREASKVGVKHIYYCDTDSLFSDKKMETGTELGEMKLEYKCRSACFLMPKTYANEEIYEEDGKVKALKLVMKGFDYKKIVNKFTVFDFMEFLRGDADKIFVTETPRFSTFKTALRLGGFTVMKNDPKLVEARDQAKEDEYFKKTGKKKKFVKNEYLVPVKRLSSFYDKRIIVEDGFDTVPINLS